MYVIYELAEDDLWYKRAVSHTESPVKGTLSLPVKLPDVAPAVLDPFMMGTLYGQAKILEFRETSHAVAG